MTKLVAQPWALLFSYTGEHLRVLARVPSIMGCYFLYHPPSLIFAYWSTFFNYNFVTYLILSLLIMGFVFLINFISFFIFFVGLCSFSLNHNGFLHFVRNNYTC